MSQKSHICLNTRNCLASGQPVKGHVRSICWKLNSQEPGGILRVILRLDQLVNDLRNSLPTLYKLTLPTKLKGGFQREKPRNTLES